MKRKALALVLIFALLISAVAGTPFIGLTTANPVSSSVYKGETSPPSNPTITISTPKNNTSFNTNSLSIILNVSIRKTTKQNYQEWISRVYYSSDWLQDDTYIYEYYNPDPNSVRPKITEFHHSLNLTGIPQGKHHITFHAIEAGYYCASLFEYYGFFANDSSVVTFTIDTTPPSVSVLSSQNKIYDTPNVPLNFTVNESVLELKYSVDGQANVTIIGNTTLTGFPNGNHNFAVYATDESGNTGASQIIYFSVEVAEPFPTALVTVASVALIVVVGVGLLVYFKKRKL